MDSLEKKNLFVENSTEDETNCNEKKEDIEKFELFPGIYFYMMDIYTETISCPSSEIEFSDNIITINHCQKGRFEGEFANGEFVYLGEGDMAVNMPERPILKNSFPLGRFQGVMIVIDIDKAKNGMDELSKVMGEIPLNFAVIKNRLLKGSQLAVYRNTSSSARIFEEMYAAVPHKEFYLKMKVLELLYHLSNSKEATVDNHRYYKKNQISIVKEIKKLLTEDLENRHTLAELSQKYGIALSSMKECFKAVYGMPVNTYMMEYRVNAAAKLLRETNISVAEISEKVGYANQSKFTEVFKRKMMMTPLEYRNKNSFID